ncbi:MAG: AMP-binding protein [Proteobacteria bacterium]|nr:AMP-binding protein [Pseudomonadota bacterium]
MNVARNLERSAFYFSEQPALAEAGSQISYGELNDRVDRIATGLIKMGLQPGEHVGICAPNSSDWITFYFAVLKTGAVAVTYSSLLSKDELRLLVDHAKPKFIFASEDKLNDLEVLRSSAGIESIICDGGDTTLQRIINAGTNHFKAVERERTDTAAVLYTGGTTGVPKGVMLTHENINTSAHNVAHNEHSNQYDRALCFLPFNHVFGQAHIMNATIYSAGCLEILPIFNLDQVLEATASGRVTKLFAVPTVYTRLLNIEGIKEKLGKVRYCFSAAASMAEEIVRQWKNHTGLTIYEGYGLTESASAVTFNHYYPERHVVGSIGTEVPGVEVQIRDISGNVLEQGQEGEICILGHNIMKGYLDNPEATREAFWEGGWFRSGDIGFFDKDGYLYIVDRLKDMIITGGENVYPREVEEIIYKKTEVEECAVVGFPDKEWGEKVIAFVVPRPGKTVVAEDLKSFLKARLSPFKVPKEYVILEEMPKSPAGKILKRELKKIFSR